MACNCPGGKRAARLSKTATRRATRLANAGVRIKPAKPKKVSAKNVTPKKVTPCRCT